MKYKYSDRVKIGKRIYDQEINAYDAAVQYGISYWSARDYLRMYKAELRKNKIDKIDAVEIHNVDWNNGFPAKITSIKRFEIGQTIYYVSGYSIFKYTIAFIGEDSFIINEGFSFNDSEIQYEDEDICFTLKEAKEKMSKLHNNKNLKYEKISTYSGEFWSIKRE